MSVENENPGTIESAIGMRAVSEEMAQRGIWDLHRTCQAAKPVDDDHITGFHRTRLRLKDSSTVWTYLTRLLLRKVSGDWRTVKSEAMLDLEECPELMPDVPGLARDVDQETQAGSEKTARKLGQALLDRMSLAFLSKDYGAWQECARHETIVEAGGRALVVTTDAQREDMFTNYSRALAIHKVTDLISVLQWGAFDAPDVLRVNYRGHMLNRSQLVMPPWTATAVFKKVAGDWRQTELYGAIAPTDWR
ncbi:MAG: hypothetical protein AAGP08_16230 [Pseudomonadota bacterium]